MKELIEYFKRLTKVSDELEKELRSRSIPITVTKGAFLHKAASICKKTYWIQKGLLRTYYLKEGKEITDVFASEGEWITSAKSFIKNEPDQYYLQAIEDSEVYALSNNDLMFLFENFHEMERFGRISMSMYYLRLSEKLESYQFTSAKDKYGHFCKSYDSILHRLPLGMVASYIGITQETLSRIRKET